MTYDRMLDEAKHALQLCIETFHLFWYHMLLIRISLQSYLIIFREVSDKLHERSAISALLFSSS